MSIKRASTSSLKNPQVYPSFRGSSAAAGVRVNFLAIAGGGGGRHRNNGGGGGAGGYITSWNSELSGGNTPAVVGPLIGFVGQAMTITVGAGGAANANGSNSVVSDVVAIGGGMGGASGGSGGGGSNSNSAPGNPTANQGFIGGRNGDSNGSGGGGGAGQAGADVSCSVCYTMAGGNGLASTITGTSVTRGGGGGGGSYYNGYWGPGGAGGGGGNGDAVAGTANTGGGGSSSGNTSLSNQGAPGGSGFVALRYGSDLQITIGAGLTGSTTTVGSDKVTTFTAGTGTVSWTYA